MSLARKSALAGIFEFEDNLWNKKEAITNRNNRDLFHGLFGKLGILEKKFNQLGELRNCIRHSRPFNEVVQKEGEAAIVWFNAILFFNRFSFCYCFCICFSSCFYSAMISCVQLYISVVPLSASDNQVWADTSANPFFLPNLTSQLYS